MSHTETEQAAEYRAPPGRPTLANDLSVKIILLKNDGLAEVRFEQKEIGNPE
jgi:hypothetical protein